MFLKEFDVQNISKCVHVPFFCIVCDHSISMLKQVLIITGTVTDVPQELNSSHSLQKLAGKEIYILHIFYKSF